MDQQLRIPEFGAFFWMRIGIIAFHIIIDVVQSICGAGKDTVGTMAHMASLAAGFCYVILVLPPMGDGTLFHSDRPYIINCGMTSPKYVTVEDATTQCLAFFKRSNGMEVGTAKWLAYFVLGAGVLASMVNAYFKRHISDDGMAICSSEQAESKNVPKLPKQDSEAFSEADVSPDATQARQKEIASVRQNITILRDGLGQMQRLWNAMPEPPAPTPAAAAPAAASA